MNKKKTTSSKFGAHNIQSTLEVAKGGFALSNLYHTVDQHYGGIDRNEWLKKIREEIKNRNARFLSRAAMRAAFEKELERERNGNKPKRKTRASK